MLTDNGPCDFTVTLGSGFNSSPGHIIKCDHVGQHPDCLVEGAEPTVKTAKNLTQQKPKQVHSSCKTL